MHPTQTSDQQKHEAELIQAIRLRDPSRVERSELPDPDAINPTIGITALPHKRIHGYIRLFPQDFIVEEVTLSGRVIRVNESLPFQTNEDMRTLWVDVIKTQLSGPHMIKDLAQELGIEETSIGCAGIKDAVAITGQELSLRGVSRERVETIRHPRLWLRPTRYGNGAVQPGQLQGNVFTVTVRTEESASLDEDLLHNTETHGFMNYFGPQRFGMRGIAHHFGRRLLQGDIDGAIKAIICESGPNDLPLYRDLRKALESVYGDWDSMLEVAEHFPFTLRDELQLIRSLRDEPHKTIRALSLIKDQVKMYVSAYSSWLMNQVMSRYSTTQNAPEEIPLPFSTRGAPSIYADIMNAEGTLNYTGAMKPFSFLQLNDKTIPLRMKSKHMRVEKTNVGFIISFELGKGAYATTCLSQAFKLYEGNPVPTWVRREDIDALAIMGQGTLDALRERFGRELKARDESREEEAE